MKIIQSFWGGQNKDLINKYGWFEFHYHWLSWMLSCYQLRKFYDKVELYTDKFGYDILINKLKLPYTNVHIVLDKLNDLPDGLWAMAKILTYSLQSEPFLHIDGDVFIFEQIPEQLMQSGLIAQNQEQTTEYYHNMWDNIFPKLSFIPTEIEYFNTGKHNNAFNMGIVGGNDIDFFQNYCKKSFDFVNKNKSAWADINLLNFNIFFEQVLFYETAKINDKKIDCLLPENIDDNNYVGFADFEKVPFLKKYLHLIGNYKQIELVCRKMEQYCLLNYPEFFRTLKQVFPDKYQIFDRINYNFTEKDNNRYLKHYKQILTKEEVITAERLFARDLFSRHQMQNIQKIDESILQNYYIHLLQEIDIKDEGGRNILYRKDIDKETSVIGLNDIDGLIIYYLSQEPIQRFKIYDMIIDSFEENFSGEEIQKSKIIIDDFLDFLISEKIITLFPQKTI
ncbi:hypothetical protein FACS189429_5960 [Bacteroidia bacterium]|nr:hypothetical protein FACS189429_5960 [Bacteroidia bacterium]